MPAHASRHVSETPATQWLRRQGVAFEGHPYDYVEHGGTAESARQLGVDEHVVIKTLVMQDEAARPLVVLMHGDRTVSTKNLARAIGCKTVTPCAPEIAQRRARGPAPITRRRGWRRHETSAMASRMDGLDPVRPGPARVRGLADAGRR